jgi:hypothetical protein
MVQIFSFQHIGPILSMSLYIYAQEHTKHTKHTPSIHTKHTYTHQAHHFRSCASKATMRKRSEDSLDHPRGVALTPPDVMYSASVKSSHRVVCTLIRSRRDAEAPRSTVHAALKVSREVGHAHPSKDIPSQIPEHRVAYTRTPANDRRYAILAGHIKKLALSWCDSGCAPTPRVELGSPG